MSSTPTGQRFYDRKAAREAARPIDEPGGCDWGGCGKPATGWRWTDMDGVYHGWLPVCDKCSRTNWDTTDGLPRRKR